MIAQHLSQSSDWYTPMEILVRARIVLGTIDLDPASSLDANLRIRASRVFTEEDNALAQSWEADTVFCNPPSRVPGHASGVKAFWEKMATEYAAKKFSSGIFVAYSMEALQTTQGMKCLPMLAFPFCIPAKRIKFVAAEGYKFSPTHGNAIIYLGKHPQDFKSVFSDVGYVV
jgi:hypothetical protein